MVFSKSYQEYNYNEYDLLCKELKMRTHFNHKNLLNILGYNVNKGGNLLCGDLNSILIFSEWYPHDLQQELTQRA